jgi:hypothetical protein
MTTTDTPNADPRFDSLAAFRLAIDTTALTAFTEEFGADGLDCVLEQLCVGVANQLAGVSRHAENVKAEAHRSGVPGEPTAGRISVLATLVGSVTELQKAATKVANWTSIQRQVERERRGQR